MHSGENSTQSTFEADSVYFGLWPVRHEQPEQLWSGNPDDPMETWTSSPQEGPTKLPLITWIGDQLKQPTYMQMSGLLIPFRN